jgi:AcrR family transcriptional regulator
MRCRQWVQVRWSTASAEPDNVAKAREHEEPEPEAGEASPLQRRHARLRRTIYEQAGALFEENGGEEGNGFEATTVEAIAARSDISTRTFFRHFESKADVIYLDLRRSMQEYFSALDRRLPGTDPFSAAVLARIDQIEAFAREPLNVTRLLRALRSRNFVNRRAAWYADLQDQLQRRLLPHLPNAPTAAAHAALAAAMAVKVGEMGLLAWAQSGGKGDPASAIAQAYLWSEDLFESNTAIRREIMESRKLKARPLGSARKGMK